MASSDRGSGAGALGQALQVRPGTVPDLSSIDPRAVPGFAGSKQDSAKRLARLGERLSDLQERLYAHGRTGGRRRILLVLQGMDTSGKGGTLRHVVGAVDPQGVQITAFRAPTEEERAHDFLWRIRRALPAGGMLGVFDRSHYEDVLVVRVHELVEEPVWRGRYDTINEFERELVDDGCVVIKIMLHISAEEQRSRLLARLNDPSKYWKYKPGDVDERELWPAYQEAYEEALARCSTPWAPWYVVPADRKWYRNWAISTLLAEHLEAMGLDWPPPAFDPEAERARLASPIGTG
jgi:PPK2 family polyphosphate:nucleotide phosphotransferase